jgi:hypothetical protein
MDIYKDREAFLEESKKLDDWIEEMMKDPKFVAALLKERAAFERSTRRLCPWGTCEVSIDPWNNKIFAAVGLVGCGCDNLPGWRSKYYEGLPKPGWDAKPVGRHGGRIARSRRKHRKHQRFCDYLYEIGAR